MAVSVLRWQVGNNGSTVALGVRLLFVMGWLCLDSVSVRADLDMTGRWYVGFPGHPEFGCYDFVQSGSSLSATSCGTSSTPITGTIDTTTGEFYITQPVVCPPSPSWTIEGTASLDSQTFVGYMMVWGQGLFTGCQIIASGPFNGSRAPCGNGVLDPGEECDDGNFTDSFDCCDLSCRTVAAGTACGNDRNDCTDDQCNGSGVCEHLNNTAPCSDGEVCTTGDTCQDGVCVGVPGCPVDHYKCYDGADLHSPALARVTATVSDQIVANESVRLARVKMICTPVDKNGEGIQDPSAHLVCYQVVGGSLASGTDVRITTQFQTSNVKLNRPKMVCVPGSKTLLP